MVITTNFSPRKPLKHKELRDGKFYKIVEATVDCEWKIDDIIYKPLGGDSTYPNNFRAETFATGDFCNVRYQLLEPGDSFTVTI